MRDGQGGVAAVFVVAVAVAHLDAVGADALLTPLAVLGADLAELVAQADVAHLPRALPAGCEHMHGAGTRTEYARSLRVYGTRTLRNTVHTLLDDFRANALVRLARL